MCTCTFVGMCSIPCPLTHMQGDLFLYDKESLLAAFESHLPFEPFGTVIFIGGLTDGFMTCPIVDHLTPILGEKGYSLVQFVMSSSYRQFGTGSLAQDSAELSKLIEHLQNERGRKKIFLLGHSTGCQDIFWYLRDGIKADHLVYGANVQAPVSDRDFIFWFAPEAAKSSLESAKDLIESGRPDSLLREMLDKVPMTAYRANSLYSRLGDDDFFSADLTVAECKKHFPGLPKHHSTFKSFNFSFSLQDEYVPDTQEESRDSRISGLIEKLIQCYPFTKEPIILPGNHDLSSDLDSMKEFCKRILEEVEGSFNAK